MSKNISNIHIHICKIYNVQIIPMFYSASRWFVSKHAIEKLEDEIKKKLKHFITLVCK